MKEHIKNFAGYIAVALTLVAIVAVGINVAPLLTSQSQQSFGRIASDTDTLAGTPASLCRLPKVYVFADATTTDRAVDGCAITQKLVGDGNDKLRLNITAKAGTATSTFGMWIQYSQDGTNYFNVATSTQTGATTTLSVEPYIYSKDFGTATTSNTYVIDTPGARFIRLYFYGEDVATDPNDGVKAWIQSIKLDTNP